MINPRILFRYMFVIIISITVNACSLSPGVPGLETSSSNVKKQKAGVDYKLIVIDAQAIKKQKPFDYVNYIKNKKKKYVAYTPETEANKRVQSGLSKQNVNTRNANTTPTYFSGVSANDTKTNYQYFIGKKDILSITVWDHPELTIPAGDKPATHVVGNDGRFYFPYAGKIKAAGKTSENVREELEQKLKSFIAKPQVSVTVASFRSQKAYLSGAIRKPVSLAITDIPLTVRDAISKTGGVIPRKYTGSASLKRGAQTISIDLNRMLKFNDNRQNYTLKSNDRLHIHEIDETTEWRTKLDLDIQRDEILTPIGLKNELQKQRSLARLKIELEREEKLKQAKVFVMGEVNKPGSLNYQIEDGMTLAEAINDAGSLNEETVNPKGIFVVRKEASNDTIPTVYQLPIASVHSMLLAEQFNIRPRDIVYITATPSIRWNRVLGLLLPSLTLLNTFDNLTN